MIYNDAISTIKSKCTAVYTYIYMFIHHLQCNQIQIFLPLTLFTINLGFTAIIMSKREKYARVKLHIMHFLLLQ